MNIGPGMTELRHKQKVQYQATWDVQFTTEGTFSRIIKHVKLDGWNL